MNGEAALLLLADSRLPAGGHAHSGGAEEAVRRGTVTGTGDLARFLRGRLATTGLVTAALAAAACELAASDAFSDTSPDTVSDTAARAAREAPEAAAGRARGDADTHPRRPSGGGDTSGTPATRPTQQHSEGDTHVRSPLLELWRRLDDEADARTASPAQREAARTQGRLLLRTARRMWPSAALDTLARAVPEGAHHPVVLGAAAAAAGCAPRQAALAAAYASVTGPATAAVRLLGLDPVAVHRLLSDLTPALEEAARSACAALGDAAPAHGGPDGEPHAEPDDGPDAWRARWAALPGHGAPALDLLAEGHLTNPMKLFVS